jgi:hypothetical protein
LSGGAKSGPSGAGGEQRGQGQGDRERGGAAHPATPAPRRLVAGRGRSRSAWRNSEQQRGGGEHEQHHQQLEIVEIGDDLRPGA